MPKQTKSKRARAAQRAARQEIQPVNAGAAPTETPMAAGMAPTAATAAPRPAAPATPRPVAARPGSRVQRPEIHVGSELRRIALIAGSIFVLIIALSFFLK